MNREPDVLPNVLRMYVIEGQVLFGKALCQVFSLEPNLQVVGDSETVNAMALAKARPDLILLDLDGNCIELTEALTICRESSPQARVCVLSMRLQPEIMQRCLA